MNQIMRRIGRARVKLNRACECYVHNPATGIATGKIGSNKDSVPYTKACWAIIDRPKNGPALV